MITKNSTNFSVSDFQKGENVLINKPISWTSFDVVNKIKRNLKLKKVGHSGTLDPAAIGLLILATGSKTKEIGKLQNLGKTYCGEFVLGKRTKSMDGETEVFEEKSTESITNEMIFAVRDSFMGTTLQIPPMFSAIKHNGKALYKYARKGVELEREAREITVSEFEILAINIPILKFQISVSKGTYVRVIADDFGQKLGCGAYLQNLKRDKIGEFSSEDAFEIDEFLAHFKEK